MNQIELFAPEPPVQRRYGMPPGVARRWELAMSPEVEQEVLAVFRKHPGEWIGGWRDFEHIIKRHGIGFCFGHALGKIVRENSIEERKVFLGKGIGAEKPGNPNYQGYTNEYRYGGTEGAPRAQEA